MKSGSISKKKPRTILARVNETRITKRDLVRVIEAANKVKEAGAAADGFTAMYVVAQLYSGKPDKAIAISFRMYALADLIKNEAVPGWTIRHPDDDSYFAEETVIAAAAVHPLIRKNKQLRFDRQTFLDTVLRMAKPEGRA